MKQLNSGTRTIQFSFFPGALALMSVLFSMHTHASDHGDGIFQPRIAYQTGNRLLGDMEKSQRVSVITAEKIRDFLDKFVDANKTPGDQVAFFTDEVEYYNQGIVGKSTVLRDVERFVKHWPYRNYRVRSIDYISLDPASERLFVSYTIDFEVANKFKAIKGHANYGALISGLDSTPKIESIKEKVTARRINMIAAD